MSDAHQLVAVVVVVATVGLLAAAAWSLATGRRSAGRRDHRFAVDRLVLVTMVIVAVNGLLGLALLGGGTRPSDPLHLLYGPLGLATPAIGWWLGGRRPSGGTELGARTRRARRDAWLIGAAVVLLGIELRLFATG